MGSNIVEWTLDDLRPADVPIKQFLEFVDMELIHITSHQMSPTNNEIV